METKKDCLSCSNSMSTEDDELYCVMKQKIVEEDYVCEEHN